MNFISVVWPLLYLSSLLLDGSNGVVVDGERKKDMAATKKQASEKEMIDPFNVKTCGLSDPNTGEHEFVNMAREGQFPWMVSFQIKIPDNITKAENLEVADESIKSTKKDTGKKMDDVHFCCGSFISDKWILSAAHCFASNSIEKYLSTGKLKVVAGSHKVSSRSSINQNITIERIFYHSSFDKSMPVGFDIALVELRNKVTFSRKREKNGFGEQSKPFMNTICLPLKDKKYKFNETARIAGWGLSSSKDETSMPSKLLTTDILISKKDECVAKYVKALKSDRPKNQKEKYDDFICASYKSSRDTCQSDSGGPLMQYSNGKAVAIGVVSYGIGCATKGVPGLYTRTSAYINWIKDITKYGKGSSVAFKLLESNGAGESESSKTKTTTSTTTTESSFVKSKTKSKKKKTSTHKVVSNSTRMPGQNHSSRTTTTSTQKSKSRAEAS